MLPNDITRGIDGADNLHVIVEVINPKNDADEGEPRQMNVGWRKGLSCLSDLTQRELFKAILRWLVDVDLRYRPLDRVIITLRLDLPKVMRVTLELPESGETVGYTGQVRLEEDDLNHRPGPTFLSFGGTLSDFEDYYKDHLHDKGEQP